MSTLLLVACLALPALTAGAQSAASVADSSPFRALQLPTPNEQRTGSGRPGPKYWQQRADYRITATLDTARQLIHGRETIHYVNNSPAALPYLWLYVEQNICKSSSLTSTLNQPPLVFADISFDFSCGGANTDGLVLDTARDLNVPAPSAAVADGQLARAEELGYARRDIAALFETLAGHPAGRAG